jgi:UDPglucose 6-dehydrogenase
MRLDTFARLAEWIADSPRRRNCTVMLKSTNILGFAEEFQRLLKVQAHRDKIRLAVNPEFLREGYAYEDTAEPWRVVIGAEDQTTRRRLERFYRDLYGAEIPIVTCDLRSAELIKLASNLYLSHRLAFIHEISLYAHQAGLDVDLVREGVGLDERIGRHYFNPGLGFGGSCLPKDCNLVNSRELGEKFTFATAETALQINERVLDDVVSSLEHELGSPLKGRDIAMLGVAFKPETDDTRGSQALALAGKLRRRGVKVRAFEPYLKSSAKVVDADLPLDDTAEGALKGADALIIGTPHRRFRSLKPSKTANLMDGNVICDRFRLLKRPAWRTAGFEFV